VTQVQKQTDVVKSPGYALKKFQSGGQARKRCWSGLALNKCKSATPGFARQ